MKKYTVRVSRTAVQHVLIEVEANDEAQAADEALSVAGDYDFNCGSSSDPAYEVEDIEENEG